MFRAPLPNDLKPEDYVYNRLAIRVDESVVLDDLDTQRFWGNIIGKLRPYDLVSICSVDGTLDVEARILSVQDGIVRHRILRAYSDEAAKAVKLSDRDTSAERAHEREAALFKTKWLGPHAKFSIVNTATKDAVERGIPTKQQADKRCAELNEKASTATAPSAAA